MHTDLQKLLSKVVAAGYIAMVVDLNNDGNYSNYFWYMKPGTGTGYIQFADFGVQFTLSSVYNSEKAGSGARYTKGFTFSGADLENALTHKIGADEVEFIRDLKSFFLKEEFYFPHLKIITKEGVKTPFEFLNELEDVYIVKHGSSYIPQLYNKKPTLNEEGVAVKIKNGKFIIVKGDIKKVQDLLQEAFPYVKKSKLISKMIF